MEAMPWAIGCIAVPLVAALISFVVGRRGAAVVGIIAAPIIACVSGALVWKTTAVGAYEYSVGGWGAPLGIDLHVDGLAVFMVAMTSLVGFFVSLYAFGYFAPHDGDGVSEDEVTLRVRRRRYFWPIWMFLWAALHGLFLSSDIFNLYITLEIVGLSAVALVALEGEEALTAATRYLLVTLVASMLYLLGVGLLYASFGTLDLELLGARLEGGPVVWTALALTTSGMVLKTALFPAHFWLPPAHSCAPTPVSSILSGLVIKASFYLLIRLWLEVFSGYIPGEIGTVLAILGMTAIVWGSLQAILQTKLKMLVAYSTVAQIGYLFVILPPVMNGATDAWRGGVYYAFSHACAKGAMFMAAGTFNRALGDGTIESLRGAGRKMFVTFAAFTLSGINLMGLPPSGGFIGKWLIARAAIEAREWLIVVIVFLGGIMAAGYVFKVVQMAFVPVSEKRVAEIRSTPMTMKLAALGLALMAIMLGFAAPGPLSVVEIGEPFHSLADPGGAP